MRLRPGVPRLPSGFAVLRNRIVGPGFPEGPPLAVGFFRPALRPQCFDALQPFGRISEERALVTTTEPSAPDSGFLASWVASSADAAATSAAGADAAGAGETGTGAARSDVDAMACSLFRRSRSSRLRKVGSARSLSVPIVRVGIGASTFIRGGAVGALSTASATASAGASALCSTWASIAAASSLICFGRSPKCSITANVSTTVAARPIGRAQRDGV